MRGGLTLYGCLTNIIWWCSVCGTNCLMSSGFLMVVIPVRIIQMLFQVEQLTCGWEGVSKSTGGAGRCAASQVVPQ